MQLNAAQLTAQNGLRLPYTGSSKNSRCCTTSDVQCTYTVAPEDSAICPINILFEKPTFARKGNPPAHSHQKSSPRKFLNRQTVMISILNDAFN